MDITKSRFRDASWFKKVEELVVPIIIGGSGGIGSWLIFFLSRILSNSTYMIVYDFDKVEKVNIAGQMFFLTDIDLPKVTAIKNTVESFTGYTGIKPMNERYDEKSLRSPIMFSAFDNMEARKIMFNNWMEEAKEYPESIFIDGRLNAEQFQIYYVTLAEAMDYEKNHLFSDEEVEDTNCSYKQTTHFAAAIAAKMVQGFTGFLDDTYELPFRYEEIGPVFLTDIKNPQC